jgi:LPPG:FO 2-phospho-L-lactate transferase
MTQHHDAPPPMPHTVAVISGGVGAARFLRGLLQVADPTQVTAVVNTGDDINLHGLDISPDLDTITYTLAGAIDPERGWGLEGETWAAMSALQRYANVRPAGSPAATTWFNLGDRDLATHMYRTARLAEGATLTQVTGEIAQAWQLPLHLVPMSDQPVRTMIHTVDEGELAFQDYFVRRRHDVAVTGIHIRCEGATLTDQARNALTNADIVVIAPSNPLVSIGPVRALPTVDSLLARRRGSVVAVSPIVGGAALKGPADRMLAELGHEVSVVGVARIYREVAATLVIDDVDAHLAGAVEAEGVRCVVAPTVMASPEVAAALARRTVGAALA